MGSMGFGYCSLSPSLTSPEKLKVSWCNDLVFEISKLSFKANSKSDINYVSKVQNNICRVE